MRRVLTGDMVAAAFSQGQRHIDAPRATVVITPDAWSKAHELGVVLVQGGAATGAPTRAATEIRRRPLRPLRPDKGSAERQVDAAGVVVVRGETVRLGSFAGAGPNRQVGLADLVTGADGSPMTAGMMSWKRDDSFPWTLDYDEIDYVLAGVLEIGIESRAVVARPGDVVYLPKGSRVIFGTPSRVEVFYVTYPAEWMKPPT